MSDELILNCVAWMLWLSKVTGILLGLGFLGACIVGTPSPRPYPAWRTPLDLAIVGAVIAVVVMFGPARP